MPAFYEIIGHDEVFFVAPDGVNFLAKEGGVLGVDEKDFVRTAKGLAWDDEDLGNEGSFQSGANGLTNTEGGIDLLMQAEGVVYASDDEEFA